METTKLTSKGQLVIPKRIRDILRATPGTRFAVRLQGSHIVLELLRAKKGKLGDWEGLNPKRVRLSDESLCTPVVLSKSE